MNLKLNNPMTESLNQIQKSELHHATTSLGFDPEDEMIVMTGNAMLGDFCLLFSSEGKANKVACYASAYATRSHGGTWYPLVMQSKNNYFASITRNEQITNET
jgi:hypothetical protein